MRCRAQTYQASYATLQLRGNTGTHTDGQADNKCRNGYRQRLSQVSCSLFACPSAHAPCAHRYLKTPDGRRQYYPCGFRAQSMFTDRFHLLNADLSMQTSALSWRTDANTVYHNPTCFPDNCTKKYVLLGEAYAGTPYEEQLRRDGLNNQHFQTWMRVSAFSR